MFDYKHGSKGGNFPYFYKVSRCQAVFKVKREWIEIKMKIKVIKECNDDLSHRIFSFTFLERKKGKCLLSFDWKSCIKISKCAPVFDTFIWFLQQFHSDSSSRIFYIPCLFKPLRFSLSHPDTSNIQSQGWRAK